MAREQSTRHRLSPTIRSRSSDLRRSQTKAERRLWNRLRDNGLGVRFRRQSILLGRFIPDFYCAQARLCIEIDGNHHSESDQAGYDAVKTRLLEAKGYRVIRFTNREVLQELEAVIRAIEEACEIG